MGETALTREKILDAAKDVLRRYGPGKATVVDVARALNVSHGSVYRHFADKAALRDAVVQTWLAQMDGPLEAITAEDAPAAERLGRWLRALSSMKRRRRQNDPEFFAAYSVLAADARTVVAEHVAHLLAQVTQIIRDGVARGEFEAADPLAAAQAVLLATAHFHHPAHAADWSHPDLDTRLEQVWAIVLRGLRAQTPAPTEKDTP